MEAKKTAGNDEPKPTAGEVMRYATDQLYALRPQPPVGVLAQILYELQAKLFPLEAEVKAPKDLKEAVANIQAKIGKMEHPPKDKPELSKIAEQAEPPKKEVA